jgi:hypothetical protein
MDEGQLSYFLLQNHARASPSAAKPCAFEQVTDVPLLHSSSVRPTPNDR